MMTALRIDSNNFKKVEKKLAKIRTNKANLLISPIDACETQLLLSYNNIPIESFSTAMNKVHQLKVITDLEYKVCTEYIIDLLNISKDLHEFNKYFDIFYLITRDSPYLPMDIFNFIKRTKFYVITGRYSISEYSIRLKEKLMKGYELSDLVTHLMDVE